MNSPLQDSPALDKKLSGSIWKKFRVIDTKN